jgi:phage virion morphogenesis protein
MDDLTALESWAGGLLSRLEAPARRAALREIARELRKRQQARIAQQKNPDGSSYAARRPRHEKKLRHKQGKIKRAAMFAKLRQARYLRAESDATGLAVGFVGRIARVARVHQYGESDRVAPGGPEHKYDARVLLGFTPDDLDMIRDSLLKHLTK